MEKERTKVSLIWGCNHVIGDDDGVRELSVQLGDLRVGNGSLFVERIALKKRMKQDLHFQINPIVLRHVERHGSD